jgi:type I site-specific restriction endonuclease
MKATLTCLLLSLITLTCLHAADEFSIRGVWFKGRIEQISQDGTKVYVVDANQSYRGWWEPAADLDAATRARLGFNTTPNEKAALAEERARLAEEKAAAAAAQAQQQAAYLQRLQIAEAEARATTAYLASEQAARDAVAAKQAADPRAIAQAKRIEQARLHYQQQLQAQELQIFNALVEVQQLELLRRLGYLK